MNGNGNNQFRKLTPLWQDDGGTHWLSRLGHKADLGQRLSRARLVYLRRNDARWGWLALCLLLVAAPMPGHSAPADPPGIGTLLIGSEDNPYVAPPLATEMSVTVSGPIARVTVEQTFVNPSDQWVEGRYLFPLPDGAAVDQLLVQTGETVIEGEIREKEQAKKEYRQAKKEGRRAGVVQQKRANLFSLALANIGPGEQVIIKLAYLETLKFEDQQYSMRLPLTMTERYQPMTAAAPLQASTNAGAVIDTADERIDTPYVSGVMAPTAGIRVSLLGDRWPERVESSSHRVTTQPLPDRVEVTVDGGYADMDRDFVMSWKPPAGEQPEMMVLTESFDGDNYALLMFLPPDPGVVQPLQRELILIIDSSGSMHGESLDQAKQAVFGALSSLAPTDFFNVIDFDDGARSAFPGAVVADSQNVSRARQFTNALSSDGGTNMAAALDLALTGGQDTGYLRQVVFITDGAVGNEHELLATIKKRLGSDRLFTVGIGPAPNGYFMRKAAEAGRGSYTFVNDTSKVREQIGGLLGKLEKPALKDIELEWPAGFAAEQWPQKIPDLYAGEPLIVAARLDRLPGSVTVRGNGGLGPWQLQASLMSRQEAPGVSSLWARRKIEALIDNAVAAGDRDQARGPVVEVALKHHLVSPYTSLLAVERKVARPAGLPTGNLRVANVAPRNMAQVSFPRTATSAALWRLAGFVLLLLGITWLAISRRVASDKSPVIMASRFGVQS